VARYTGGIVPRVYLDASFVSACVTDRTDPNSLYRREASREWWDAQRAGHEVFVSAKVLAELSQPAFRRATDALKWIEAVPLLDLNDEVAGVASVLVREKVMPAPAIGDAVHVAASAVHRCEYLLSWNVRHLANPNKVTHLQAICRRLGVIPPRIVTPDFLWEDQR